MAYSQDVAFDEIYKIPINVAQDTSSNVQKLSSQVSCLGVDNCPNLTQCLVRVIFENWVQHWQVYPEWCLCSLHGFASNFAVQGIANIIQR